MGSTQPVLKQRCQRSPVSGSQPGGVRLTPHAQRSLPQTTRAHGKLSVRWQETLQLTQVSPTHPSMERGFQHPASACLWWGRDPVPRLPCPPAKTRVTTAYVYFLFIDAFYL